MWKSRFYIPAEYAIMKYKEYACAPIAAGMMDREEGWE